MSDLKQNQRTTPRVPIELRVEYKKLNMFFHDYTRNISKGGTFIKTPRPLGIGTEFLFTLLIPRLQAPLTLKGRVKWVITQEQAGAESGRPDPGMGIEFIYATDEERQGVSSEVGKLMIDELGERAYAELMGEE